MEVFNHSLWLLLSYQNLGFFIYGLYLYAKERQKADLFFGLCCFFVGINVFLFHISLYDHNNELGKIYFLLAATAFLPLAFYYLSLKAKSLPAYQFNKKELIHFIPFFVGIVWLSDYYAFTTSEKELALVKLIANLFFALQLIFYIYKTYGLLRQRLSREKQKGFIYTRPLLFANLFFVMLLFIFARNFLSFDESRPFSAFYSLIIIALNIFFVFFAIHIHDEALKLPQFSERDLVYDLKNEPKEKYTSSPIDDDTKKILIEKLEEYFDKEQPYLNPKLCLNDVAQKLNTNNKYLSQIINEYYAKNFTNFVNDYRCKRVIEYFKMEEYANFSLDGIAESAGFHSRSSFVAAFKKHTQQLPSVYRNDLKKNQS